MKLTIEKDVFLKALNHGQNVVERRTTVPILSNVLLKAEGEHLTLTSTDLEISIVESVPAFVERPGQCTAPARTLHEIVRKLRDGAPIELEYNSVTGQLILLCGKSDFSFPALPVEEFPMIQRDRLPCNFSIPAKDLYALFDRSRFAMSSEEARYYLNGVYLHVVNGHELRAVATDGHRLAKVTMSVPKGAEALKGVIVSRKAVTEVLKLLQDSVLDVDVSLSDTQITFTIGDAYLTSRLVDGTFPDYEPVIPKANDKVLTMPVKLFTEAVDRIATVASDREKGIKLILSDNNLKMLSTAAGAGSGHEELTVNYVNDNVEIGFNARYLLEIAQQIRSNEAEVLLSDAGSPVLVRDLNDKTSLFVIMPLKV